MPDAALRLAEQQFRSLLAAASRGRVQLRLLALPGIPRRADAQAYVNRHYEPVRSLAGSRLDGLIVTGAEPRAGRLTDEPCWPALARLAGWVEDAAIPCIWSCLAAHAAVLHLDGVERRALPAKLSGVFAFGKAGDHAVTAQMPRRWAFPHSRLNDLPEADLARQGYQVLGRSAEAGVDIFVRKGPALSLFLQGHPEYDAAALLREYHRDIARSARSGGGGTAPIPWGYFSMESEARLAAGASVRLDAGDLRPADWQGPAISLYAGWLSHLAEQRCQRVARRHGTRGTQMGEHAG